MRRHLRTLLVALLAGNLALVGASWWLARASERAHPPIGELASGTEPAVHLVDHGAPPGRPDAPVIVLVHGASTSLLDMEASLAPLLSDAFRVVTVDRPGHGYSERGADWLDPYAQARAVRDALGTLGIDEAVWVGHSWAGSVVLAAALEERAHVAGAVLIAGVTHPWEGGNARHVELAARPVVGHAFAWQYIEPVGRVLLDEAIASAFAPEPVPAGYVDRTGVLLSLRPTTYRANARDLVRLSAHLEAQSARYGTITAPVLSMTGTADEVVPAWNHDARLAEQLPALRSIAFDGAGHAFHHTRTARVAELIAAFARDAAAPLADSAPPPPTSPAPAAPASDRPAEEPSR